MCILIHHDVETLQSILTHTELEYKVFPVGKTTTTTKTKTRENNVLLLLNKPVK